MDAKEDIKQRLSIEDVISEYVQLKRAGRNFKGLSPFSSEKTPSFVVSPEKQIWHDFSSGKGGDLFSFVMEMEGLDFKEVLDLLARKAGVDMTQYQTGRGAETGKLKERLYAANEAAARFYQVQFSKHTEALEYIFKQRKFTKQVALDFRIGYSPNGGTALLDFLKKKGFTEQEIQKSGLATKRYNGMGDMFRGRIMLPLQDPSGRVIGFTARLLIDDPTHSTGSGQAAPKYINTPQTLLYDKSRHVYGLNLAKDAIRFNKYAVMVEGNMDVIASHQAGVKQVFATAGTAMTDMHLKALKPFAEDIRMAYDQDKAGLAATERAIPMAGNAGVSLSIITIPQGKDPDELIRKDPAAWQKAIDSPEYALDWLIRQYESRLDLTSAVGKREFSSVVLKVIRSLPDSVEQDHYLGKVAELLGVAKTALEQKMGAISTDTRRLKNNKVAIQADKSSIERAKTQNQILSINLMQPALRHYLDAITPDMFVDDVARKLLKLLHDDPQFTLEEEQDLHSSALLGASEARTEPYIKYGEGALEVATTQSAENTGRDLSSAQKPAGMMQNLQDYVKILVLLYEELYQGLELLELRNEAARLQTRLIEQYVKSKKQELAAVMRTSSANDMEKLLEQAKQLDVLLRS